MVRKPKARMIGYCRVSTSDQAEFGVSLAAQRHTIESYADATQVELVDFAVDEGVSGRIHPYMRPAMRIALERIGRDSLDGLVVFRLDRLGRNLRSILDLLAEADRCLWTVLSAQEGVDTKSAMGRFTLQLTIALAELESSQNGERVKVGMAERQRQSRPVSRYAPFGYRLGAPDGPWEVASRARDDRGVPVGLGDQRLLCVNPEEQALRDEIIAMLDAGKTTWQVCVAMRKRGIAYPRGGAWRAGPLRSMYVNEMRRRADVADKDDMGAVREYRARLEE